MACQEWARMETVACAFRLPCRKDVSEPSGTLIFCIRQMIISCGELCATGGILPAHRGQAPHRGSPLLREADFTSMWMISGRTRISPTLGEQKRIGETD